MTKLQGIAHSIDTAAKSLNDELTCLYVGLRERPELPTRAQVAECHKVAERCAILTWQIIQASGTLQKAK